MNWHYALRLAGLAQALMILGAWLQGHADIQVFPLSNPSMAGTFVALTLFDAPFLPLLIGALAVVATTRHVPLVVLGVAWGWHQLRKAAAW